MNKFYFPILILTFLLVTLRVKRSSFEFCVEFLEIFTKLSPFWYYYVLKQTFFKEPSLFSFYFPKYPYLGFFSNYGLSLIFCRLYAQLNFQNECQMLIFLFHLIFFLVLLVILILFLKQKKVSIQIP